jgi:hypothetical protein
MRQKYEKILVPFNDTERQLTHIFGGEIAAAFASSRHKSGIRRHVGMVHYMRPIHRVDWSVVPASHPCSVENIHTAGQHSRLDEEQRS